MVFFRERKKSEAFLECIGVPNIRQEKKKKAKEYERTQNALERAAVEVVLL